MPRAWYGQFQGAIRQRRWGGLSARLGHGSVAAFWFWLGEVAAQVLGRKLFGVRSLPLGSGLWQARDRSGCAERRGL